jgi:hypothetical protein
LASLLLLFWLLASVGLEVREVKDRLASLGLHVRQLCDGRLSMTTGPTTRWTDTMRDTQTTPHTAPVTPTPAFHDIEETESTSLSMASFSSSSSVSSILRPTFTSILPPPSKPHASLPPVPPADEPDALGRPITFYFPALLGVARRADRALESIALGRGLRRLVVGLGRALVWVVTG